MDCVRRSLDFNPRPLRGGRRSASPTPTPTRRFQSTPPARGATLNFGIFQPGIDISIHAPCEGGDTAWWIVTHTKSIAISIHAPCEGGDFAHFSDISLNCCISIHAPCEGGDVGDKILALTGDIISIHAPCEGGDSLYRAVAVFSRISIHAPCEGGDCGLFGGVAGMAISIHAPCEGGDSKDAQFYLRIFDKQVELLRFLRKMRGGCLRNPEKDRRFLGKSLANLPEISGHLDFAGGGKAHPGYPCAVPLLRRAACVRGSGDPPADRCSSYRNAPLFSHIASLDSKSADCLSQNP